MSVQIAKSDVIEQRGRLRFREMLFPWQIVEFDGKYPALDGYVHVFEEQQGPAVASKKPLSFLVQHTSKETTQLNASGECEVSGIKIDHLLFWVRLPEPVMLTVFLADQDKILYWWATPELLNARRTPDQKEITIRFPEARVLNSEARKHTREYLTNWYPELQSNDNVLRPGQPGLYYFFEGGFGNSSAWDRFQFNRDFGDNKSAFIIRAEGKESVGLNLDLDSNIRSGKTEICYRLIQGSNRNVCFTVIAVRRGTHYQELRRVTPHLVLRKPIDASWQTGELHFDLRELPNDSYAVLAPRINEGAKSKRRGILAVHSLAVKAI